MRQMMVLATIAFMGMTATLAHAEETMGEKAQATANDAGRAMKKGAHRTEEALCTEGDAKCAEKKVKHRASETGDYVKDKSAELKHDVDSK